MPPSTVFSRSSSAPPPVPVFRQTFAVTGHVPAGVVTASWFGHVVFGLLRKDASFQAGERVGLMWLNQSFITNVVPESSERTTRRIGTEAHVTNPPATSAASVGTPVIPGTSSPHVSTELSP